MLDFTKEERDFIAQAVASVPVQGTLRTLPRTLQIMASILKKLENVETPPNNTDPVQPDTDNSAS